MSDGNDTASVGSGSRAVGRYGENLACRQLEARGMRVLARNWRCRVGEIDIVAVEGDVLVVCEVKTRRQVKFGAPAEAVTAAKVRRLRVLAAEWLATQAPEGGFDAVRVDVISVLIPTRGAAQVEHLIGVE